MTLNVVYYLLLTILAYLIKFYSVRKGGPLEIVKTVIACGGFPANLVRIVRVYSQIHDPLNQLMVISFSDYELIKLLFISKEFFVIVVSSSKCLSFTDFSLLILSRIFYSKILRSQNRKS